MPNVYNQLASIASAATVRVLPGHIYGRKQNGFTRRRSAEPKPATEKLLQETPRKVIRIKRSHPIFCLLRPKRLRLRIVEGIYE